MKKIINNTMDMIYVVYDAVGCYLRECHNIADIAAYFGVSKSALSQYMSKYNIEIRSNKEFSFLYRNCRIEYFNINKYNDDLDVIQELDDAEYVYRRAQYNESRLEQAMDNLRILCL